MRKTIRDDDGAIDRPAIETAPLIRELETDLRFRLRIDVSQFLQDGGVDSQFDEPSQQELQLYVLALIKDFLEHQACLVDVRVGWLDAEYEIRAFDAERIWRT